MDSSTKYGITAKDAVIASAIIEQQSRDKTMSDKEIITAWITKYALSQGIFELQGRIKYGSVFCVENHDTGWYGYFRGKDFWLTKEDAIAHAKVMQQKKLASLRKQIAKIESLNFEE